MKLLVFARATVTTRTGEYTEIDASGDVELGHPEDWPKALNTIRDLVEDKCKSEGKEPKRIVFDYVHTIEWKE